MNTDLVVLREVFANVLHDHGPGRSGKPPSEDWRDCFNADAHGGTATRLVAALREEGEQVDDGWLIEGLVPVITGKVPSLSGSYAAPRELAAAILRELRQVVVLVVRIDGEETR